MDLVKFKKDVFELMLKNRRTSGEYQYTVPSPETYPFQWLWDSCFHAIILAHLSIEDAKKELESLVAKQFDNGMIPHMIYWDKAKETDFRVIEWGKKDTSSITQPAMLAFACWYIFQKDKDKKFLSHIYPQLKKFYLYLITERDPRRNHLIGIINPDESGEDNSPRFDIPMGIPSKHSSDEGIQKRLDLVSKNLSCNFAIHTCMRDFFWVKDVPFNAIMVANLNIMAKMAKLLGQDKDAAFFSEHARLITQAMRKFMLEDGLFWSTYDRDYKKIKVLTWAIFSPLFAKICTDEEAENLIDNFLLNKNKFKLKFVIPTVSQDDSSFDPQGFWRGSVWIAINWFIYKGLLNYGRKDLAQAILKSSLELIERSGFREYFNPLTGEGLGAKNFTWGGLILDMLE